MAYIPYTYAPPSDNGNKVMAVSSERSGVSMARTNDTNGSFMCNMDVLSDRLSVRNAQEKISDSFSDRGILHGISKQPFNDRIVLHMGTGLYSFGTDGTSLVRITDALPDKDSIICHFMSRLYIYCDRRVFSIDTHFSFEEHLPDAPLLFENLSPVSCYGVHMLDVPCNLIAPRFTVSYGSLTPITDLTGTKYTLPRYADTERTVNVFVDGVELAPELFSVSQERITILRDVEIKTDTRVEIIYYAKNGEDIGYDDSVYSCKRCIAYGGNTNGGTRLFFTGNSMKKGYYYKSDVHNPLYIASDNYEILADGCEDVTALIKMYGNLIIFTEKSVHKMTYNLTSSEAYFTVKELSDEVGCDCPSSVQLIDNRVVFANSKKGVFIIDETNDTGEQNIKPISGNVLKDKDGVWGLLDNDGELLKSSESIDFDRKYMLFVGDKVYVWDYNKCGFADYSDYSKAQGRLCWYIYDDVKSGYLFELDSKLISLCKDDFAFYAFFADADKSQVEACICSSETDFSEAFSKKIVTDMNIMLLPEGDADINVILYADGNKYYEKRVSCKTGKVANCSLVLPQKKLTVFSYEIRTKGDVEIAGVLIKYMNIAK